MKKIILTIIIISSIIISCQNEEKNIIIGKKAQEFSIQKKDSATYSIELEKDKFYSFKIMQNGIDVELFLKDNYNKLLIEKDSPNGSNGLEQFYFYCEKSNKYFLQIKPFDDDENPNSGKYKIEILEAPKKTKITLSQSDYLKDFRIFKEIFEKANAGLYKYHTKKEIDSVFLANENEIAENTTYLEFYNLLWNVIDYTGSCHNSLDLPQNLELLLKRKHIFFPIPLKSISGKLYTNFEYKDIPIGTEIISINGIKSFKFIQEIGKFNSTDGFNKTGKVTFLETSLLPIYMYYKFGEQDSFTIEYIKDKEKLNQNVSSVNYDGFLKNYSIRYSKKYENRNSKDYSFKLIDSINTGLLTINTFNIGAEETNEFKEYSHFLDSTFTLLHQKKIKSLIVDIRKNGGGIDPCDLLLYSYLTKRNFKENKSAFTLFNKLPLSEYYIDGDEIDLYEDLKEEHSIHKYGKYYQNDNFNKTWHPKNNAFNGKIYVLISPYVASAGSLFASMCKSDAHIVMIGEETLGGYYGHTGHVPVTYELPNSKLLLTFSIVDLEQDVEKLNDENYGDGIKPDFKIIQTYSDFMNNVDTELNFTIEKIKAENIKCQNH